GEETPNVKGVAERGSVRGLASLQPRSRTAVTRRVGYHPPGTPTSSNAPPPMLEFHTVGADTRDSSTSPPEPGTSAKEIALPRAGRDQVDRSSRRPDQEGGMSGRRLAGLFGVIVLTVVAVAGSWGVYRARTPRYAIERAIEAIRTRDAVAFATYIDVE